MTESSALLVDGVDKTFILHLQDSQVLPVLHGVSFEVRPGQCVVLGGDSGAGKSTIMKMVHGSYAADRGSIVVRHRGGTLDLAQAAPREVLAVRRESVGYVSQFLRAVPRVAAIDVVAEPLIERGTGESAARLRAGELLTRVNIPERLWALPPATFSGGEQQRVNIARGFASEQPLMLLDEPTASLDARNRGIVIEMIRERLATGAGVLAIFHDQEVREALADDIVDVSAFTPVRRPVAA